MARLLPRRSSGQAEVAELADALDSGSSARKGVGVRVPASAPSLLSSCRDAPLDAVRRSRSHNGDAANRKPWAAIPHPSLESEWRDISRFAALLPETWIE